MAPDIEKGFYSVNHSFLIIALEKYGSKENFIKWIKMLIQNQESRCTNLVLLIEGGQKAISRLKEIPNKLIQF